MNRTSLKALAGLSASLGLVAALATPARAAYTGGEGRLAYVKAGDIYTTALDATTGTRLTTTGDSTGPRWSPDGTRIAYVRGAQLWVMKADGTAKHRVGTLTGVGRPAWSPNGRYLAVAANGPDAPQYSTLFRVTAATGAAVPYHSRLTGDDPVDITPNATAVAWSADGKKLTAESTSCQYGGLYELCTSTLNLATQTATQATETIDHEFTTGWGPPYGRVLDPDWAPDSSSYAYTELTCDGDYTCVSTVHLAGGATIPNATQAVYSPNGDHVAYVRADTRSFIFTANTDGTGEDRQVIDATQPDWQPTH